MQQFYSTIKVIAYAVLTVRIYKRINQSNASAKAEKFAEPDKPVHRQQGVRPHHVCDDSKVLAEYWINDIEKVQSAMNGDF